MKKSHKGKQFYRNSAIKFAFACDVKTYDIRRAGLSVLKNKGIISQKICDAWNKMSKENLNIFIGKNFSEYFKIINDEIVRVVDKFILENNIPSDKILAKDRDSITILNASVQKLNIDGYEFSDKEVYTSFINTSGYVLLYNFDTENLRIYGLNKDFYKNHPMYAKLKEMLRIFEMKARGIISYTELYKKVYEFKKDYAEGNMCPEIYREMRTDGGFSYKDEDTGWYYSISGLSNNDTFILYGGYNFHVYIKPLIVALSTFTAKDNTNGFRNGGTKKRGIPYNSRQYKPR